MCNACRQSAWSRYDGIRAGQDRLLWARCPILLLVPSDAAFETQFSHLWAPQKWEACAQALHGSMQLPGLWLCLAWCWK